MYDFMQGKLTKVDSLTATLELNNIGYRLLVPVSIHNSLPPIGSELLIYISLVVRETSHLLYGFLSAVDRDLFEILIEINGVGPKLALSIIGHLSLNDLQNSIVKNDTKVLCVVPGIGKKTAERLIIDLRDKIARLHTSVEPYQCQQPSNNILLGDAITALVNLGYNQSEAQRLLKKGLETVPEAKDLGTLISAALKTQVRE